MLGDVAVASEHLLRGDGMGDAERILLAAVARVVLSGERGDLADQLNELDPKLPEPEDVTFAAVPSASAAYFFIAISLFGIVSDR